MRMLLPIPEDIQQSASFVFSSPHIQANPRYRERVLSTHFALDLDDPTFNAYATDQPPKLSNGARVKPPAIVFCGGLAAGIRLASGALAAHIRCASRRASTFFLPQVFQEMGNSILEQGGKLSLETVVNIFGRHVLPAIPEGEERFVTLARSYAAAMEMFVIAHESGHLALSHTQDRR